MTQPILKGLSLPRKVGKTNLKFKGLSIKKTGTPGLFRPFLKICDEKGDAIENANIDIEDANKNSITTATTDEKGRAWTRRLQYADQPLKIKIAKKGYKRYQTEISLDEKIDWTISLEKVKDLNFSERINISTQ